MVKVKSEMYPLVLGFSNMQAAGVAIPKLKFALLLLDISSLPFIQLTISWCVKNKGTFKKALSKWIYNSLGPTSRASFTATRCPINWFDDLSIINLDHHKKREIISIRKNFLAVLVSSLRICRPWKMKSQTKVTIANVSRPSTTRSRLEYARSSCVTMKVVLNAHSASPTPREVLWE